MDRPIPTEQHELLHRFVGDWMGTETGYPPDDGPLLLKSRITCRMELGGFFLLMGQRQTLNDRERYQGHGVFGWDSRNERYTMYWFDSEGWDPGVPASGTWDGDTLRLGQKTYFGQHWFTYRFQGPDAYTYKLEHSPDGKDWTVVLEGRYERAASKA